MTRGLHGLGHANPAGSMSKDRVGAPIRKNELVLNAPHNFRPPNYIFEPPFTTSSTYSPIIDADSVIRVYSTIVQKIRDLPREAISIRLPQFAKLQRKNGILYLAHRRRCSSPFLLLVYARTGFYGFPTRRTILIYVLK